MPPTADEERVTREHCTAVPVPREPADAVLCVAGRVEAGHGDVTQLESLAVCWRGCDTLAITAANYRKVRGP